MWEGRAEVKRPRDLAQIQPPARRGIREKWQQRPLQRIEIPDAEVRFFPSRLERMLSLLEANTRPIRRLNVRHLAPTPRDGVPDSSVTWMAETRRNLTARPAAYSLIPDNHHE
jgi:hypothetical protein